MSRRQTGLLDELAGGRYALGLSGGADSTAMLVLLRERRPDMALHVVHLNHQTRGEESDQDEQFVRELAKRFGLACTIARRREVEPRLANRAKNKSALFRAMRFHLFARVVRDDHLNGVLLAHHADDQSETIMHRLLRGSNAAGLGGMAARSMHRVGEQSLVVYRPLLEMRRERLREILRQHRQNWREDSSNQSDQYLRNRLRQVLRDAPELEAELVGLGVVSRGLAAWMGRTSGDLDDAFAVGDLWDLPPMIAAATVKKYLRRQGCASAEITPAVVQRLLAMANDAATPAHQTFPGNIILHRRGGRIGK